MKRSTQGALEINSKIILKPVHLNSLFDQLKREGFSVLGPTVQDGAIVYGELRSSSDLPVGWAEEQEAGFYRLKKTDKNTYFGYNLGPHTWKKYLLPPKVLLWRANRLGQGFEVIPEDRKPPKLAFMGVRSCELHAIFTQDRIFLRKELKPSDPSDNEFEFPDPIYESNRASTFIIAVQCTQAAKTCFCTSMKTGPKATSGYDLAITEVLRDEHHFLHIEIGTRAGAKLAEKLPHVHAESHQTAMAEEAVDSAATHITRSMDTSDLRAVLYGHADHPRWQATADRCLTCGNCTLVCPTCFCTTIEDTTSLNGETAERWRRWDSCFTLDFSYIHGGNVRVSAKSRYRQWLTHKLATWMDQFGVIGCVGCGRCIAWCPVGIDLTEEVRAIRKKQDLAQGSLEEKCNANL